MNGSSSRFAAVVLFALSLPAFASGTADRNRETDERTGNAETVIAQSAEDFATIEAEGGFLLINNVWNKQAARGPYAERIFLKEEDGRQVMGWEWKWSGGYNVVAYPEILFGDSPWDNHERKTEGIPFLAGTKDVTVDYHVRTEASGIYNMALEFWVVSQVPASSGDITHEVMIWTANSGMRPAGRKKAEAVFGGVTYDLYLRDSHGDASGSSRDTWTYIAFVAHEPVLDGPLDLGAFIRYLLDERILDTGLYVTTIELGNEIVQGSGRTEVSGFAVTIR